MLVPIDVSSMTKNQRKALIRMLQGQFTDRLIIQLGDTMVTGHGWQYAEQPSWYSVYYKDKKVYQDAELANIFALDNYSSPIDEEELEAVEQWFSIYQPEW